MQDKLDITGADHEYDITWLQGCRQRRGGCSGVRTPHLKSVLPISRLAPRLLHTSNTVF